MNTLALVILGWSWWSWHQRKKSYAAEENINNSLIQKINFLQREGQEFLRRRTQVERINQLDASPATTQSLNQKLSATQELIKVCQQQISALRGRYDLAKRKQAEEEEESARRRRRAQAAAAASSSYSYGSSSSSGFASSSSWSGGGGGFSGGGASGSW